MAIKFLSLLAFLNLVIYSDAKDVGVVKRPQFSFVEKDDIMVKYEGSSKPGVKRQLYFCCLSNDKVPAFIANIQCGIHPRCPIFKEVESCEQHGKITMCYISYIMTNTTIQGYISQSDSKNVTVKGKVATYVTSDSDKKPRPVTNLTISTKGGDLHLRWTPSQVFFQRQQYSQEIHCQPVGKKNAKALRKVLNSDRSHFTIHWTNIDALTMYNCCVHVENKVTSNPSEPVCAKIESPEQAPSKAPIITCGNATRPCQYNMVGSKRNMTITFKLPKPEDRNGMIVYSIFAIQNTSTANTTQPNFIQVNGSATSITVLLKKKVGYLISVKSCTKNGCSPFSNTVRIEELPIYVNHKFPMSTVAGIAVTCTILFIFFLAMSFYLRRRIRNAKRGKLDELSPTDYIEYSNAVVEPEVIYNTLHDALQIPQHHREDNKSVCSAENFAVYVEDET